MYPHCGGRGQEEKVGISEESLSSPREPGPLHTGSGPQQPVGQESLSSQLPGVVAQPSRSPQERVVLVLLGCTHWEAPGRGTPARGCSGHHGDCPIKPPLCRPDLPFCLSPGLSSASTQLPLGLLSGARVAQEPTAAGLLGLHSLPGAYREACCHTLSLDCHLSLALVVGLC